MANYYGVARTNYFKVTDEKKYEELVNNLLAEDAIHDFSCTIDGELQHGFGSYSPITYCADDEEVLYDLEVFLTELQKILPDGEAFIYQETGYEKLRYVTGFAYIVTNKTIEWVSLEDSIMAKAKELLGEDFTTQLDY